jgi:hypothetical protein
VEQPLEVLLVVVALGVVTNDNRWWNTL